MKKLKELIKKNTGYFVPSLIYKKKSFSQCGEDLITANLVNHICNKYAVKYIDIGANHPFSLSNTALFYFRNKPRGGGVLVEPNPELARILKVRRNKDIVLNLGISATGKKETIPFYVIDTHVLSTFSKKEAEECEKMGHKVTKVIRVKTVDINSIFKKYFPDGDIDLMNLDTEGFDLKILKTIDYKLYKPKIICVETVNYRPKREQRKQEDILKYLLTKGYKVYGETGINTIFLRKEFENE